MRISLGPNLYFWPREQVEAFYARVVSMPVDVVYLGETVCSKRRPYGLEEWLDIARALRAAGKEVVLSTLTLIEARSELGVVKRLCQNGEFMVEANDFGAVRLLAERRVPFATGPNINIYNPQALRRLVSLGLRRWVVPVEISRDALRRLLQEAGAQGLLDGVETEVYSYGRLPLAYSARCFTARAHNLPKDNCQLKCRDYPEGLAVRTQEGSDFLTANGIQTQSGLVQNLLPHWRDMQELGVSLMRISPRPQHTDAVVRRLRALLDGAEPNAEFDEPTCDGFWRGAPGMSRLAIGA